MATQSRRKRTGLIQKIQHKPGRYEIFQMVRLIENLSQSTLRNPWIKGRINEQNAPKFESVGFEDCVYLEFPVNEITQVKLVEQTSNGRLFHKWIIETPLLGFTGMLGVLPQHYSDLVIRQLKIKDKTLKSYLNVFKNRSLSLYFRSWSKYRIPLYYEKNRLKPASVLNQTTENSIHFSQKKIIPKDPVTQALLSLIGLGNPGNQNRLQISDDALAGFSGFLSRQSTLPAVNIERMIQHYFGVPIQIQQFVPQKKPLFVDTQTRLEGATTAGQNHCLGLNTLLGQFTTLTQSKFKVILGPLNYSEYESFAPNTERFQSLIELVKMAVGNELDFDVDVRISQKELPHSYLGLKSQPLNLNWNATLAQTRQEEKELQICIAKI